jgi:hypothetical protein
VVPGWRVVRQLASRRPRLVLLTPPPAAAAAAPQVQMPEGDVVAVDGGDVHPGGQVVDVEYKDLK